MSNLENLKTELLAAKATIEPQIEGLHDFARLNILPPTKEKVDAAIVDFERRLKLIGEAIVCLDNLTVDKYPEVAQRDVADAVYADLADQVKTVTAAFQKFSLNEEAVGATITPGTPRDQP